MSSKINRWNDAGTGDLGVLTTHEASPVKMATLQGSYQTTLFHAVSRVAQTNWRSAEDVSYHSQGRPGTPLRTANRRIRVKVLSLQRTVEPGLPPSATWSIQLVMPAQPAPGECGHKFKYAFFRKNGKLNQIQHRDETKRICLRLLALEVFEEMPRIFTRLDYRFLSSTNSL